MIHHLFLWFSAQDISIVQNVVTVTKPRILKTVESIISVYLNVWENEERENVWFMHLVK